VNNQRSEEILLDETREEYAGKFNVVARVGVSRAAARRGILANDDVGII
jgi:hypothetical protein